MHQNYHGDYCHRKSSRKCSTTIKEQDVSLWDNAWNSFGTNTSTKRQSHFRIRTSPSSEAHPAIIGSLRMHPRSQLQPSDHTQFLSKTTKLNRRSKPFHPIVRRGTILQYKESTMTILLNHKLHHNPLNTVNQYPSPSMTPTNKPIVTTTATAT